MPEYGVQLPLWDEGGPIEDAGVVAALGLSAELIEELRLWQAEWDDVCSAAVADDTVLVRPLPAGWSEEHQRRGEVLLERVREQLQPPYRITYQV